jgi:CheY-like chemotaxis protein
MSGSLIFLVEDDDTSRDLFRLILTAEGYDVRAFSSAEDALDEIAGCRPAAVVLDQHLPIMDGLECLRRLREYTPDTPVALLTGDYFIDEGRADEFARLGAEIHFKPVWDTDLLRILHGMLTREPAHGAH